MTRRVKSPAMTDCELFFGAVRGDRSSFRRLAFRYTPLVTAEICTILPRHATYARGLTSAILGEVYRHLPRLRKPARFQRWILALTRRACSLVLTSGQYPSGPAGVARLLRGYAGKLLPLRPGRKKRLKDAVEKFGRLDYARELPSRLPVSGPLVGVGEKLAELPPATRRVFYYHVVAGKSPAEIRRILRLTSAAVSLRLLRCLRPLGLIPWNVQTEDFSAVRSLARLMTAVMGAEASPETGQGGKLLEDLRLNMRRYRQEAAHARLATREIEKLSFQVSGMILSPGSMYRWNAPPERTARRLLSPAVSAGAHAVVLGLLAMVVFGVSTGRLKPPRIQVHLETPPQEAMLSRNVPDRLIPTDRKKPRVLEEEDPLEKAPDFSNEDAYAELLYEMLKKEPYDAPEEVWRKREKVEKNEPPPGDELMQALLEQIRDSVSFGDRPALGQAPFASGGIGGYLRGGQGIGPGGLVPGGGRQSKAEQERLERARKWRQEAHAKLKDRIERVQVTTICFAELKDIAYDKKSAFLSLEHAREYVKNNFLDDMVKQTAKRCKVDEEKARAIWENRKTTHPKTVHLGVSGTRAITGHSRSWLGLHPIIRKRILEFLIATAHCEIKRAYKEPCWRCAGKGSLEYISSGPRYSPCPICKGLGYELVIVYK